MKALFVNSAEPNCGVHQFGLNLWRIIETSKKIKFEYCAPTSEAQLISTIDATKPEIVFFNFYPCTFPWLTLSTLDAVRARGAKLVSIYHEVRITGFDAYVYPDPTFAGNYRQLNQWFPMGRPLPKAQEVSAIHREIPLISSSGFGFAWKGHRRLTRMVVEQFERATLRLHLPFAKFGDADGTQARETADCCRAIVAFTNPNIELLVDHNFMEPEQFVDWLAESDLNAYLYDEADASRGIASTTDHALAARRPIALTRTRMFRHLHHVKGIFVEDSTLPEILARGIEPLKSVYQWNSEVDILREVEDVLSSVSREKYCRLLRNADRARLAPIIKEMHERLPEMMARKIPEANVQQAWTVDLVRRTGADNALCVGCFEDTGFHFLNIEVNTLVGIDPSVNMSLREFTLNDRRTFDCVFATSVIEHVKDDSQFIRDLCDNLNSDGVCILTADFKEGWYWQNPRPATDERLYTSADIDRIAKILHEKGCYFVDQPDTSGAPDFHYQGHDYSFIGLVFKKL